MNKNLVIVTEDFVKKCLAGEGTGHDWWHIERIRNTAKTIQATEGGDLQTIDMALLLHDVGDRKVIKQDKDDYTIAENFLREQGVNESFIDTVMDIIKRMSYSSSLDSQSAMQESIEFQIVQDADRLDALGAIGIARAFAYGGSRSRPLYDPEYNAQEFTSSEDYKNAKSSSLHHFDEKLFLLKDLLNTETAKQIATKRDTYMRQFKEQFLDEWAGKS